MFERAHAEKIGDVESLRYRKILEELGVKVHSGGPREVLRSIDVDTVFFEFYFIASPWIDEVRVLRPKARIIVDSVDVHFRRLTAKALLTNDPVDAECAVQVKAEEISVYRRADIVIAVTDDDASLIAAEVSSTRIATIPNSHFIHEPIALTAEPILSFVGGFAHEPNADAVLYFCKEILHRIKSEVPSVIFNIIGNSPPAEVQALSSNSVRILGYVPDISPYMRSTLISVAPLRYGAGMKGKVGEAMSLGLPVVTTSVGAEGFGLTPGRNVLIGDTPQEFAEHVVRLIRDVELREQIGLGGHRLIQEKYSDRVVMQQVVDLFQSLAIQAVKSLPRLRHLKQRAHMALQDHMLWRFNGRA